MTGLRSITVCVDYADILAVTLPRNLKHFDEFHVVTDRASHDEVVRTVFRSLGLDLPRQRVMVHVTDLFTADGATFNKWRALEWGLDQMGRRGWLCVMDADVVWPRDVTVRSSDEPGVGPVLWLGHGEQTHGMKVGHLCSPYRRMWHDWPLYPPECPTEAAEHGGTLPVESAWDKFFVRHRNVAEWAGYSQIFHADDPVLGPPPWHEVDWKHCGGADSIFQRKWPADRKVRPPWEVLHLGPAGHNWMGRVTPRADGTVPEGAAERLARIMDPVTGIWARRREVRRRGGSEADTFRPEKLRNAPHLPETGPESEERGEGRTQPRLDG